MYWAGLKSRVSFRSGDLDWALINSLIYFGYSPDSGPSERATPLLIGFEFQRLETIYPQPVDMPMDLVVTETGQYVPKH
jgi:hypothetical protein